MPGAAAAGCYRRRPLSYEFASKHKAPKGQLATHTLMTGEMGGRFQFYNLPGQRDLDELYHCIAQDWQNGYHLAWIETPPPNVPSRLYFDLDLYFVQPLENEGERQALLSTHLSPLFEVIQHRLRDIFLVDDPNYFTCIVGSAGLSLQPHHGSEHWKLGLHLIWPNIYVQTPTRLSIRSELIASCRAASAAGCLPRTNIQLLNDWDDVWDLNVARTLTSRMFGSVKFARCDCAKQGKKSSCDHVGLNKFINHGRRYELLCVLDAGGSHATEQTAQLKLDRFQLLKLGSLRPDDATDAETEHVDLAPPPDDGSGAGGEPKKRGELQALSRDDGRYSVIQDVVASLFPRDADHIKDISKSKSNDVFMVNLTSRECPNNWGQQHHSSTAYIKVSLLFSRARASWLLWSVSCERV